MMRGDSFNGLLSTIPSQFDLSKFASILSKDEPDPNQTKLTTLVNDALQFKESQINIAQLPKILQQIEISKDKFHTIISRAVHRVMNKIIKIYQLLYTTRDMINYERRGDFPMEEFHKYGKQISDCFFLLDCIVGEAEKIFPWACHCKREVCANRYERGRFLVYICSHICQISSPIKTKIIKTQIKEGRTQFHLIFYNCLQLKVTEIQGQTVDYALAKSMINQLMDIPQDDQCKVVNKKKKKKHKTKQKQNMVQHQEQAKQVQYDEQTQSLLLFLKQMTIVELNRVPCNVQEEWLQRMHPSVYLQNLHHQDE